MSATDDPNWKRWVKTWKQPGPRPEAIRREELRNFRYEDHFAEIDALMEIAYRFARTRPTSGLVEQQRLFAKLRDQRPK